MQIIEQKNSYGNAPGSPTRRQYNASGHSYNQSIASGEEQDTEVVVGRFILLVKAGSQSGQDDELSSVKVVTY